MPGFGWVWDIPERFNIAVACTDAHLGTPVAERAAVIVDDDAAGVRQATFAGLGAAPSRFAKCLRQIGIGRGARVLIRLSNCLEYPIVFLGAMKRAAIPVPTSVLLTPEEVLHLARDSGATAVVTDQASWRALGSAFESLDHLTHVLLVGPSEVRSARLRVLPLDAALAGVTRWPDAEPTRAEDPAYLVYTSGTSGLSEGGPARAPRAPRPPAGVHLLVRLPSRGRPRPPLGQAQLDLRARHRPDGPALSGPHRDRARGAERRGVLAAAHRAARCHHLHRRAHHLPADPAEDARRARRRAHAAALHERGRASLGGGSPGVARALRPRHLRGPRHDRVLLLPLPDQAPPPPARVGRLRAAGARRQAARPADVDRGRDGRGGDALHPARRPGPHARLLESARGDGRLLPRRLVPDRRLRAPRRRRLHLVPRPQGRPSQELRLPRLAARGRAGAEGPSRGVGCGGHGRGGRAREARRGRLRRAAGGERDRARRGARLRPPAARVVQGAEGRLSGRRAAAHAERQSAAPGARSGARPGAVSSEAAVTVYGRDRPLSAMTGISGAARAPARVWVSGWGDTALGE